MIVAHCPIKTYGSSTGRAPIQVRMSKDATINQNNICDRGLNWLPTLFLKKVKAGRIKITRAIAKAITPPNLLGIERRIAYNHKKYHSG